MTTRYVHTDYDRQMLHRYLDTLTLPFTVSIKRGGKRSLDQNRLQHMWFREVAEQLQDRSPEEVRGYSKLHFGVPIMRGEDDEFREAYDRVLKPLPYEQKLAAMMEPLDFPVTRRMNKQQMERYLDEIWRHFTQQGIQLTQPIG